MHSLGQLSGLPRVFYDKYPYKLNETRTDASDSDIHEIKYKEYHVSVFSCQVYKEYHVSVFSYQVYQEKLDTA